MNRCESCPPGTYSSWYGWSSCQSCAVGYYSSGGQSQCYYCPGAMTIGATSCSSSKQNSPSRRLMAILPPPSMSPSISPSLCGPGFVLMNSQCVQVSAGVFLVYLFP